MRASLGWHCWLLSVALAFVLVAAACGSSDDTAVAGTSTIAEQPTTTAKATTTTERAYVTSTPEWDTEDVLLEGDR